VPGRLNPSSERALGIRGSLGAELGPISWSRSRDNRDCAAAESELGLFPLGRFLRVSVPRLPRVLTLRFAESSILARACSGQAGGERRVAERRSERPAAVEQAEERPAGGRSSRLCASALSLGRKSLIYFQPRVREPTSFQCEDQSHTGVATRRRSSVQTPRSISPVDASRGPARPIAKFDLKAAVIAEIARTRNRRRHRSPMGRIVHLNWRSKYASRRGNRGSIISEESFAPLERARASAPC